MKYFSDKKSKKVFLRLNLFANPHKNHATNSHWRYALSILLRL